MNINNPTTFGTPSLTWTTSNSSGTGGALRADDSVAIFSATVPETIAYGQSAAAGDDAYASRLDHVHGMAASDARAAATQAEIEAASSTSVFISPGRQQFQIGAAKGYGRINGAGTLHPNSYNISSVTVTGTGDHTIVWDVDFSNANYTLTGMLAEDSDGDRNTSASSLAVGSVVTRQHDLGTLTNIAHTHAAFGDQ